MTTSLIPLAPFLLVGFLALLGVLVLGGLFVLVALRIVFGGKKRNRREEAEEARLMQDLHRGFQKLEERVESLETIMLEKGATAANANRKAQ